nr:MAG TPA: hypothetical protein [Caudoviricetes sp.]
MRPAGQAHFHTPPFVGSGRTLQTQEIWTQ